MYLQLTKEKPLRIEGGIIEAGAYTICYSSKQFQTNKAYYTKKNKSTSYIKKTYYYKKIVINSLIL